MFGIRLRGFDHPQPHGFLLRDHRSAGSQEPLASIGDRAEVLLVPGEGSIQIRHNDIHAFRQTDLGGEPVMNSICRAKPLLMAISRATWIRTGSGPIA